MGGYHDGDDADGLEEEVDCVSYGEPEEYPEDVGDEEDGADVDGEWAEWLLLPNELQLRVVSVGRHQGHSCIAFALPKSTSIILIIISTHHTANINPSIHPQTNTITC